MQTELAALVERIRLGDREALRALISEYGAGVYRKAYLKTQDKDLAREATRRTFAQLVTTLQEQTELDGWALWLDALAKRNIETYGNIKSDMVCLQSELVEELYAAPDKPALQSENPPAMAAFWQEGPFAAQQPYTAAAMPPQSASDAQAAQFAAKRQLLADATVRQSHADSARNMHQPARPAMGRRAGQPTLESDRAFAPKRAKRRGAGATWAIIALSAVCLALLWLVLGVLMSLGWLPKVDLGYEWCNRVLQTDFF